MAEKNTKKSFEFRMSKKVAELTQVVHMLFTRNHEKEVEIEALKKSYEHEIDLVLEDAKGRIGALDSRIEYLEQNHTAEIENLNRSHERELAKKEIEWKQKHSETEHLLQEERGECQNLRDLLINAQKDIEKLRQGVDMQLSSRNDDIARKEKELDLLQSQLSQAQNSLKEAQRDAQSVITELQKANEKLEGDYRQLHGLMENSHKTRDQLLARNKQLETEMKTLRREFNKRVQEAVNSQIRNNAKSQDSGVSSEEVERLKREIQRYRLELSNRDANFNRMFTDKQPMVINQKSSHSTPKQSMPIMYTYNHSNTNDSSNTISGANPSNFSYGNPPQTADPLLTINQSNHGNTFGFSNNSSLFSRSREASAKNSQLGEVDKTMHFVERPVNQERTLSGGGLLHERQLVNDFRPRTQGQFSYRSNNFKPERIFSTDKHQVGKQASSSFLMTEEPSQILPQKRISLQGGDRPPSSSLPSICSTPEQRQMPTQLTKPKPLPRELLYSK